MSQAEPVSLRLPVPRVYTTLREHFAVPREAFLPLAARAAASLPDATFGTRWTLDGHTSEYLFLRLPPPPPESGWLLLPVDLRLDVAFGPQATDVELTSASRAELALFVRFTAALRAELLELG